MDHHRKPRRIPAYKLRRLKREFDRRLQDASAHLMRDMHAQMTRLLPREPDPKPMEMH